MSRSAELSAKIKKNSEKIRKLQKENEELTAVFQEEKATEYIDKKLGRIPKNIRDAAKRRLLREEGQEKPKIEEPAA